MRQMHNHYFLVKHSFVNGILYEIFLSCDLLCAKWRPHIHIEDQVVAEKIQPALVQSPSGRAVTFQRHSEKSIVTSSQGDGTPCTWQRKVTSSSGIGTGFVCMLNE